MRNEYPNPMITYPALEYVYDYLNKRLFRDELRKCLITLEHRRTACGFFAPAKFRSRDENDIADQIGLDPRTWGPPRTDRENLSVVAHEMTHLWQHYSGKAGKGGYHNREFARKMQEIGLIVSDTGEPGGKQRGNRMGHYIEPDGPFDRACSDLLNSGFAIPYIEIASHGETMRRELLRRTRSRAASKTNYVCPNCGSVRVWGKPGLRLACRACEDTELVPAAPSSSDEGEPLPG